MVHEVGGHAAKTVDFQITIPVGAYDWFESCQNLRYLWVKCRYFCVRSYSLIGKSSRFKLAGQRYTIDRLY